MHATPTPSRRSSLAALFVAITIGIIAATTGTSAAESPASPSVDEILARNADARGGLGAWRAVNTLVQIGRIERRGDVSAGPRQAARAARIAPDPTRIVSFRLDLARPNKMRLELNYGGATAIQAFDGREGYTVQPGPGTAVARPFTAEQMQAATDQLKLEGPLLDARAKGTTVVLDGIEPVRARPAYKLTLTTRDGATHHVWVDAQSYLDVKIDGVRQIGDRAWPIETYFDDFRRVGDVQVPYDSETAINGVHTMEHFRVEKVILNAPLEASRFTLPKAPAVAPESRGR